MNEIHDRGMIKWQPFDSLTNSKAMCHSIVKEKCKISMPVLSDDQLELIEELIQESYHNSELVSIDYYYDGNILNKKVKIKYIDYNKKEIVLSDLSAIYYRQITKITII